MSFVSFNTMLTYELVARRYHRLPRGRDRTVCTSVRNDLNDVYFVTQTVQEIVEISQLQYIDNMVNISLGIVQVSRMRVVTKTDEIPQLPCTDEFINDSGVRAPQVLIVEKTVVISQHHRSQLVCSS